MIEVIETLYVGATVNIDVNWLIGIIGVLGTSLGSVAGVLWAFTISRLRKQDTLIDAQNETIGNLQKDIARLTKGCGAEGCVWRNRD